MMMAAPRAVCGMYVRICICEFLGFRLLFELPRILAARKSVHIEMNVQK